MKNIISLKYLVISFLSLVLIFLGFRFTNSSQAVSQKTGQDKINTRPRENSNIPVPQTKVS